MAAYSKEVQKITSDKFVNDLETTAKRFGLHGMYIEWNKSIDESKNGVYFVLGADKEKVESKNIDIEEIFERCKKNPQILYFDVAAIKLSDGSGSFANHQTVTQFCRDLEFVLKVFKDYNRPTPDMIDYASLLYLKTLYKNAIDPSLKSESTKDYKDALENYIHVIEDKMDAYASRELNYKKGRNQVSLEDLFEEHGQILKQKISLELLPDFKKVMKDHPEILYYCSKPNKITFKAPEKGFGPNKSDNDLSTVTIAYLEGYKKDIDLILTKIAYPEAFKMTVQEMRNTKNLVSYFGIQETEFPRFADACRTANVHFSIDDEHLFFSEASGHMSIAFYEKDAAKIDKILSTLAKDSELYHVFSNSVNDAKLSRSTTNTYTGPYDDDRF
jgi:hypothetical protein